jgi:hypothetical protein
VFGNCRQCVAVYCAYKANWNKEQSFCAEGARRDCLFPVNSVELGLCKLGTSKRRCDLTNGTLLQLMMGEDNNSRSNLVVCMQDL